MYDFIANVPPHRHFHTNFSTAAKLLHSTLDLPEDWWVVFEMKQSICEDISNQIMDLYDESEH